MAHRLLQNSSTPVSGRTAAAGLRHCDKIIGQPAKRRLETAKIDRGTVQNAGMLSSKTVAEKTCETWESWIWRVAVLGRMFGSVLFAGAETGGHKGS